MWNQPVRRLGGAAVAALLAGPILAAPAGAAVPHVVQPGETLWSIAAASNFTTRTVAVYNGLPETATVAAGQTIQIPIEAEGAAALQSAGLLAPAETTPADPAAPEPGAEGASAAQPSSGTEAASSGGEATEPAPEPPAPEPSPTAGYGHISSSFGALHLAPAAAESWEAMRQESLRLYGQDLQPAGPISAHRTYAEQGGLYRAFLDGQGAPANPPGTSAHEAGLAVDLATPEMRWVVDQIGWQFGWGKVEAPGEWWHVNYVGGG